MNRIAILVLFFLLLASTAFGETVKQSSTSKRTVIKFVDSAGAAVTALTNTDIACAYWRPGDSTATTVTDSALATLGTAYTSGGIIEVDATNLPGIYRFDAPDAMWTSLDAVTLVCTGTGALNYTEKFDIEAYEAADLFPIDGTVAAATSGTVDLDSTDSKAPAIAGALTNRVQIHLVSGTGAPQVRCCRGYSSGRQCSVNTWDTTPDTSTKYRLEYVPCGIQDADIVQINDAFTNTYSATLKLKQLDVQNSTGNAAIFSSTGSNGAGITATGNGTGAGLHAQGGATADGLFSESGATSGYGLRATGVTGDTSGISVSVGCGNIWSCNRSSYKAKGTFGEGINIAPFGGP